VVAPVRSWLIDDAGVQHRCKAVQNLSPDVRPGPMTLDPEPCGTRSCPIRAYAFESTTRRRQLDDCRHERCRRNGEVDRFRDTQELPTPDTRQTSRGGARNAARVPEHDAEKQRIR